MFLICLHKLKYTIGQFAHKHSQQIAPLAQAQPIIAGSSVTLGQHKSLKESYENGMLMASTYYVRDVAGQAMAVYSDASGNKTLLEQPIYGTGQVGISYNGRNNKKTYVYELTMSRNLKNI